MLPELLKTFLVRDLNKLKDEISLYNNENIIWTTDKAIANSAGNLCLHLVGNLNTYIGAVYGNTGYTRNRELEFSLKGIAREALLKMIGETITMIESTLPLVTEVQLAAEFPLLVWETKTTSAYMLVHLATHLGYHLGQVNYHRRLLDTKL